MQQHMDERSRQERVGRERAAIRSRYEPLWLEFSYRRAQTAYDYAYAEPREVY